MQLINRETQQPIVEFRGKEILFFSKFLEHEMRIMGIPVPPGQRSAFNGRDCVFLDDEDFQRAFKEIYYPRAMDPATFHWQSA